METAWKVVGRDEEIRLLTSLVSNGRSAVVAGPAGVGKTRLLGETLTSLAPDRFTVKYAVATASTRTLPFGVLASWLPPKRDRVDVDPMAYFQDAVEALSHGPGGTAVVIGIDDAHLIDALSATLVHHLAFRSSVSVLMTLRYGESVPDAIVALWKDGVAERVDLQPLAQHEVDELLHASLGKVDSATRIRIWNACSGNVLFLRELLLYAVQSAALRRDGGIWRLQGPLSTGPRLADLVARRVDGIPDVDRRTLEAVAIGQPLGVTLLEEIVPGGDIAGLERRGLLAVERSDRRYDVRLGHPLYGEAVRDGMPKLEERRLEGLLADAVERHGARRRTDLLRVVTWRLDSGRAPNPGMLAAAAGVANATTDYVLAERLAREALRTREHYEAALALGESLVGQERYEEAEEALAPLEVEDQPDEARVRLVLLRCDALFFGLGRTDEVENLIRRATDVVGADAWKEFLLGLLAALFGFGGRCHEALELAEDLLQREDAFEPARLRALSGVGIALALSGRPEAAIDAAMRAFPGAMRIRFDWPRAPTWPSQVMLVGQIASGRLAEAEALLEVISQQLGATTGDGIVRVAAAGLLNLYRGRLALMQGRVETAVRLLDEAAQRHRSYDAGRHRRVCLAFLARALAMTGRLSEARAALDESTEAPVGGSRWFESEVTVSAAWVAAAAGEHSRGRELALEAADHAAELGQHTNELIALYEAVRLGDERATGRLLEVAPYVEGRWPGALRIYVEGIANGDGELLDAAASAFEHIGALLAAAEASAAAGAVHRQRGRRARAAASAARMQKFLAACEGARTPALQALTDSDPLTRREREIAALAAQGLSSSDIAGKLVISVRTVDNTLHRVYGKLGVSGRPGLVRVMAGEAPTRGEELE